MSKIVHFHSITKFLNTYSDDDMRDANSKTFCVSTRLMLHWYDISRIQYFLAFFSALSHFNGEFYIKFLSYDFCCWTWFHLRHFMLLRVMWIQSLKMFWSISFWLYLIRTMTHASDWSTFCFSHVFKQKAHTFCDLSHSFRYSSNRCQISEIASAWYFSFITNIKFTWVKLSCYEQPTTNDCNDCSYTSKSQQIPIPMINLNEQIPKMESLLFYWCHFMNYGWKCLSYSFIYAYLDIEFYSALAFEWKSYIFQHKSDMNTRLSFIWYFRYSF